MIIARPAALEDAHAVAPLFDAYRQFYGKPADLDVAKSFITERLTNGDSTVFIADDGNGNALGFAQLYPSFSSVSAGRIYVLNDLFVAPEARGKKVARTLMYAVSEYARRRGALRLALSTEKSNEQAQALYESEGWVRDQKFYHYSLAL